MLRQQIFYVLLSVTLASVLSFAANYFGVLTADNWYHSLFFFLGLNLALFTIYALTRRSTDFTGILLGCLVGKMLLSLLYLVLTRIFSTSPFLPFAIHFIAHFAIFTTFEIRYVLWLIRTR